MPNDFDLIVREVPDASFIKIYNICDVHIGSIEHNRKGWERFCANVMQEENSYIALGGDLINNNTKGSVGSVFEDDERPRDQKRRLVKYLAPLVPKLLCAVPGNHEGRSGKDADDNPIEDAMNELGIGHLYRENAAFIKLSIGKRPHGSTMKSIQTYCLCVVHGAGGGIYTGATVNRNERFGYALDGVDVLMVGHSHKGAVTKPQKVCVDMKNNTISMRQFAVVSAAPWMSYGGYALRKMMLPAAGQDADQPQTIYLSGEREKRSIRVSW